jgi:glycosyltransferase involved in cell wall biosynthesis
MAEAARDEGVGVRVLGPSSPPDLELAASALGVEFVPTRSGGQMRRYPDTRRTLHRARSELTWCNGPFPGLAALGLERPWVLHLHQRPSRSQAPLVAAMRRSALRTVVPSHSMESAIPGSAVLWNWTREPFGVPTHPGDDGVLRIGFLGRLSPIKGVSVLANAVEQLLEEHGGRVRLLLAGDTRFVPGAYRRQVRKALARIRDACEMLGWVDPRALYPRISVLAVPSVWDEPFGLVAAEAMSERMPVVVTDAGALPEVVGGDHPWVARRADPGDLASVLQRVWRDPEGRARAVEEGRERWQRLFSPAAGHERFVALLRDLGTGT